MELYLIKEENKYTPDYVYNGPGGYAYVDENDDKSAFKAIIEKYVVTGKYSVNRAFFLSEKSAENSIKSNIRVYGDSYYNSTPTVVKYIPNKAEVDELVGPLLKELKKAEEKYLKLKAQYTDLIK